MANPLPIVARATGLLVAARKGSSVYRYGVQKKIAVWRDRQQKLER
jgi:hypothetical protein